MLSGLRPSLRTVSSQRRRTMTTVIGTRTPVRMERQRNKRKVMRKHLRNFRRPLNSNLALERDVIFPTLRYLSRNEILLCSQVCKPWNAWTTDPSFWNTLNASGKRISPPVLVSIVRRQPLNLDLSWTQVSKRQIAWLMPRLPQLQTLSLSGCSAAAASALVSCNTPLLKSLDLSWIDAFDDDLLRDLTSSPADQRPGLVETKTRLRTLHELNVAGSEITDASLRLMSMHLPNLIRVDLRQLHTHHRHGNCLSDRVIKRAEIDVITVVRMRASDGSLL